MSINRVAHGRFCGYRIGLDLLSTQRCRVLATLIGLVVIATVAPAEAEDTILGQIRVGATGSVPTVVIGPIRCPCEAATVFQAVQADASQADIVKLLAKEQLLVIDQNTQQEFPAQWEPSSDMNQSALDGNIVWLSDDRHLVNGREFRLVLRSKKPLSSLSVHEIDKRRLIVKRDGEKLLQYNFDIIHRRSGESGLYDRACYIHPIWSPLGKIVTGDFSPEHIQQRGIFTAWIKARFGNLETDFWGLGGSKGRILPTGERPSISIGPVFTKLIFGNQGVIGERVVMRERVEITVYSGRFAGGWIFDLRTTQTPLPEIGQMEIPQIHYGGTSFRGPAMWLRQSSRDVQRAISRGVRFEDPHWLASETKLHVLTSQGHDRISGNGTMVRWIDYTGPLGGDWGGLAMYDHPSNPRYPTPVRIHPELPYFSLAIVQNEPLTVTADSPLQLFYRTLVHDGHPDAEKNEQISHWFVNHPTVTWTSLAQ